MEKVLAVWPMYAPAAAIVAFALAMRLLWGARRTWIAIWIARVVFVVSGIAWELSTDSPFWFRALNGIFAAIVASVVFSEILEAVCKSENTANPAATSPDLP